MDAINTFVKNIVPRMNEWMNEGIHLLVIGHNHRGEADGDFSPPSHMFKSNKLSGGK